MNYIGIDFHKQTFTVCYRTDFGQEQLRQFENNTTGIDDFFETISCRDAVAIESMSLARHIVKKLQGKVKELVLVNPTRYRLVSSSIKKTDENDASLLAYGLEHRILPISRFRSEAAHQLACLLSTRHKLVKTKVSITNYMYALTAREGIKIPRNKMKYQNWRDSVDTEQFEYGDKLSWIVLCDELLRMRKNILELEKEIDSASRDFEGHGVLASIPFFGPITVATLVSYIDGIDAFDSAKALCSYFGIVPRTRQSAGENVANRKFGRYRAGAITRQGSKRARTAIVMSANRVLPLNASLKAFYDRIKGRKGYRKARTAAARKLLTFIYFALKNGKPIEDFGAVDFARPHLSPN